MARLADDRFRIFVSHKHEDNALAVAVQQALEGISPKIECFVSGVSIAAGADWNREIRSSLAQSHLLILLFTRPTATWDWCLFETGLFTRARHRGGLRGRLPLRPDGDHAEPTGQPAGHPGTPRRRGALPRRPLPRNVAGVRRLAPRRPASPRAARPARGRGSEDRRRLPGAAAAPESPTIRATASSSTCATSTPSTAASLRPRKVVVGPGATTHYTLAMFNLGEVRPTSRGVNWSTPSTAARRHGARSSTAGSSPP